ncbi:MAG: hypothetical protein ACTJLM_04825 [Ehrlichia sp.]
MSYAAAVLILYATKAVKLNNSNIIKTMVPFVFLVICVILLFSGKFDEYLKAGEDNVHMGSCECIKKEPVEVFKQYLGKGVEESTINQQNQLSREDKLGSDSEGTQMEVIEKSSPHTDVTKIIEKSVTQCEASVQQNQLSYEDKLGSDSEETQIEVIGKSSLHPGVSEVTVMPVAQDETRMPRLLKEINTRISNNTKALSMYKDRVIKALGKQAVILGKIKEKMGKSDYHKCVKEQIMLLERCLEDYAECFRSCIELTQKYMGYEAYTIREYSYKKCYDVSSIYNHMYKNIWEGEELFIVLEQREEIKQAIEKQIVHELSGEESALKEFQDYMKRNYKIRTFLNVLCAKLIEYSIDIDDLMHNVCAKKEHRS